MQTMTRPRRRRQRTGLHLLALLLIPLLLVLHAPVLAALVPGALLAIASLESVEQGLDASAQIVGVDDVQDIERIAAATPVSATSRRV